MPRHGREWQESASLSQAGLWARPSVSPPQTFRISKVRFILTSLGMVIGTASLILVVTIGLTGKQYLLQQIQNIGSNMMIAEYSGGGIYGRDATSDFLTLDDLNAVREQVPGISNASPHDRVSRPHYGTGWQGARHPGARRLLAVSVCSQPGGAVRPLLRRRRHPGAQQGRGHHAEAGRARSMVRPTRRSARRSSSAACPSP